MSRRATAPEALREQETEVGSAPEPVGAAATTAVARGELSAGLVPSRRDEPSPLRHPEAASDVQRALPHEPDRATPPAHVGSVLLAAMSGSTLRPRPEDHSRLVEDAAMRPPAQLRAPAPERASAARAAADAPAMPVEPPIVRISIGRIDVRVTQAPTAAPRQPAARPTIGMSLESYLRRREGGAR